MRDAPKVPYDDDGMDLLLRLRGGISPLLAETDDEGGDRATIPRWMGNRRLLSQGRKGDLPNQ